MSLVIESSIKIPGGYYKAKLGDHNVLAIPVGHRVLQLQHPSFLSYKGLHWEGQNNYHVYESYYCTLEEFELTCDRKGYSLFDDNKRHPSKTLIKIFEDILRGLNFLESNTIDLSLKDIVIVKLYDKSDPDIAAKLIGKVKVRKLADSKMRDDLDNLKTLFEHFFCSGGVFYNEEAKNLIKRFRFEGVNLLLRQLEGNILRLLRHPLFFDDSKAMEYFRRYGDFLEKVKGTGFPAYLNKGYLNKGNYIDWNDKFPAVLKDKCEESRKDAFNESQIEENKYYKLTSCLVKYYRNVGSHYFEIINSPKKNDEENDEENDEVLFNGEQFPHISRVMRGYHPNLLIYIYNAYEMENKLAGRLVDEFYLGEYLLSTKERPV